MPVGVEQDASSFRAIAHGFALRCADAGLRARLGALLDPLRAPDDGNNVYVVDTDESGRRVGLNGRLFATGLAENQVADALLGYVNIRAVSASEDHLLVHAGGVSRDDRAVILPAASGSGKTSLTLALVEAGLGYLTDETVAVRATDLRITPYPKPFTVKAAGQHLFPHLRPVDDAQSYTSDVAWHVPVGDVRAGALATAPASPALIVAPRFAPGASTEVTPMSRGEAMVELGANSSALHALGPRVLEVLDRVSARAPAFRLVYSDLNAARDRVLDLLERSA